MHTQTKTTASLYSKKKKLLLVQVMQQKGDNYIQQVRIF